MTIWRRRSPRAGRAGAIYAGLKRIRDTYASLVREHFPDIPRRVSGYNLDQLLPENGFHVARALVGTEATCVTVLEATVRLVKSPQYRQLVVLGFADAFAAADAVPEILNYKPIGLEGFDGMLVDFLRRKQMALDDIALLPDGRGFLLVEFGADTDADARAQADRFLAATLTGPRVRTRSVSREKRPSASGGYANLLLAQLHLSRERPSYGRAGKTPPFHRRSWAPICAGSRRWSMSSATSCRSMGISARAAFTRA